MNKLSVVDEQVKKVLLEIGFNYIGTYGKFNGQEDDWGEEWIDLKVWSTEIESHVISLCDGGVLVIVAELDWLTIPIKSHFHDTEDGKGNDGWSEDKAIALAKSTITDAIAALYTWTTNIILNLSKCQLINQK